MIPFEILKITCKSCGEKHLLYAKEYQCYTCKKVICKSCSRSLDDHLNRNITNRECVSCHFDRGKAIRKMIAVESGIIREYNIVNESNAVVDSLYFSEPNLAIEHLKHMALLYGFDAITYLRINKAFLDAKDRADFSGSKFRRYPPSMGYSASGILVLIEKQSQ
jgi:hypothetical protein